MPAGRQERLVAINGLLCGIGVLIKVNGGLGVLFFPMMIMLFSRSGLKEKIMKIVKFGLAFLLPVVAFNVFFSIVFHFNLIDGFSYNTEEFSIWNWGQQAGSVYSGMGRLTTFAYAYAGEFLKSFGIIGLFLSLIGFLRECFRGDRQRLKIYLALSPFSLSFLIYPPTDSRFAFIAAPLLIIWATYGLAFLAKIFSRFSTVILPILIAVYVVSNYYFCTVGSYRLIFLQLINYLK
jgi:hypothetical protein